MENKLFFCINKAFILSRLLCFCCLFVGLYSCQEEDNTILNTGKLSFQMGVDTTLVGSSSTRASNILELSGFDDPDSYKVVISQDSGVVAEYARFDKMPAEIELEAGAYSVEVSKGTKTAAAFNSPYFSGKQDFTIVKDMTTPVEVTASMENSRVTVDFSDDFVETYTDYTLSFKTNKMTLPLVYEKGEYRPMYFQADASGTKLTIGMELVNVYGKDVQYTATTTIKQKQWTKLTVRTDEKGLNGVAIDVVLNDETKETVYVNIGIPDFMEQLKGAPIVTSSFFNWDGNATMTEPTILDPMDANTFIDIPEISVLSGGKVDKAILSVTKDGESVLNIDFANLEEEKKAELESLYAFGLPETIKGQMSFDFNPTGLLNSLKPEKDVNAEYIISLSVTDALPKSNTTNKLVKITLNKPKAPTFSNLNEISGTVGKFDDSSSEQRTLTIDYGSNLVACSFELKKNNVTVIDGYVDFESSKVVNNDGNVIDGLIWNQKEKSATFGLNAVWLNTLDLGSYILTVEVEDEAGYKLSHDITLNIAGFEWDTEQGDLFAKYMFLRIKPAGSTSLDLAKLKFINKDDQTIIATGEKCKTDETGVAYFVWNKLTSGTTYRVIAEYDGVQISKEFSTETEFQIPDGGFDEEWTKDVIEANSTDVGGLGLVGVPIDVWYPYQSKENAFWSTNNIETTSASREGGTAYYIQYSGTQKVDNAVELTTLGYGDGSTFTYFKENGLWGDRVIGGAPKKVSPAALYSITNENGSLIEGHKISSRPSKLLFDYKYKPYDSDQFVVSVVLETASGEVIVEKRIQIGSVQSDWKRVEILDFSDYLKDSTLRRMKADRIKIRFESGINQSYYGIHGSVDNLQGNADSKWVGSVLTLDNIQLIYDDYIE